jgi:hypothetical protein
MSQPEPEQNNTSTFDRVLLDNSIEDINQASDELKFTLYILMIETILKLIQVNFAWELPDGALNDYANCLLQIDTGLYELQLGSLGTKYDFKPLRESIGKAVNRIGAAFVNKAYDRFEDIRLCKQMLEEAIDIIGGFSFPQS